MITPQGPRLLEGNSGWGTATPQMLIGGLLAQKSGAISLTQPLSNGLSVRIKVTKTAHHHPVIIHDAFDLLRR